MTAGPAEAANVQSASQLNLSSGRSSVGEMDEAEQRHFSLKDAIGTERTCRPRRPMSAVWGRPDSTRTSPLGRFWHISNPIDGQSMSALPSTSDINLFCNRNRVVNFDAQIANSALDFSMAEQ